MFESLPYTINENGYINYDKLVNILKYFNLNYLFVVVVHIHAI